MCGCAPRCHEYAGQAGALRIRVFHTKQCRSQPSPATSPKLHPASSPHPTGCTTQLECQQQSVRPPLSLSLHVIKRAPQRRIPLLAAVWHGVRRHAWAASPAVVMSSCPRHRPGRLGECAAVVRVHVLAIETRFILCLLLAAGFWLLGHPHPNRLLMLRHSGRHSGVGPLSALGPRTAARCPGAARSLYANRRRRAPFACAPSI